MIRTGNALVARKTGHICLEMDLGIRRQCWIGSTTTGIYWGIGLLVVTGKEAVLSSVTEI